jgi:hypothetical protein
MEITESTIPLLMFLLAIGYFIVGFIVLLFTIYVDKLLKSNLFWKWNNSRGEWVRTNVEAGIVTLWPLCTILLLFKIFWKLITGTVTRFIDKPNGMPDRYMPHI